MMSSNRVATLSNRASDADGLAHFYNYIPHVHRLLRSLRESDQIGEDGSETVIFRSADCCQSSADIAKARYARRHGKEINEGSGLSACRHLPYKPFDGGISFEDSSRIIQEQVSALLDRKRHLADDIVVDCPEIILDQETSSSVLRYHRRNFVVNLERYPRNSVKNKTLEISVHAFTGDPDLYVSVAEPPTEKDYLWRSCLEGRDVIKIHPEDPNYRIGSFYIAVSDPSTDCNFRIRARVVQPTKHNDEENFGRIQFGMYQSIKNGIHVSEHRRRLCAVGKITNLDSALKYCLHPKKEKNSEDLRSLHSAPLDAQQLRVETAKLSLPMLVKAKKIFQTEKL